MPATPKEDFILKLIDLPADGPEILHLHYQSYLNESTLQPHPPEGPIPESQFISTHLPYLLSQFSSPSIKSAKLMPLPTPSNPKPALVAYIVLKPPASLDQRSEEETRRELREEVEGMGCDGEASKEITFGMIWEGKMMNEKFLGKGYEARFWLLDALFVDEECQRRGLGRRLVEWGLDAVEGVEDVKSSIRTRKEILANSKEGQDNVGADLKVEGVYLISSPIGEKTYLKCGFEKIGEKSIPSVTGKGGDFLFSWYLKKLN